MRKKTKKSRKKATKKSSTLTVHELVSELAKALSISVPADQRRRITLRVSQAKQAKRRKVRR